MSSGSRRDRSRLKIILPKLKIEPTVFEGVSDRQCERYAYERPLPTGHECPVRFRIRRTVCEVKCV